MTKHHDIIVVEQPRRSVRRTGPKETWLHTWGLTAQPSGFMWGVYQDVQFTELATHGTGKLIADAVVQ